MISILDHVSLHVRDMQKSKPFYEKALAPLGIKALMDFGMAVGFGKDKPELWLGQGKASYLSEEQANAITPIHLALKADSRTEVDAFYAAAIAAGGRDNGKPGLRPQYHANYYGAFVIDPDGHNLEVVVHHE